MSMFNSFKGWYKHRKILVTVALLSSVYAQHSFAEEACAGIGSQCADNQTCTCFGGCNQQGKDCQTDCQCTEP